MSGGVLDPQGPVAFAERLILLNATTIMLVVVVPVIVLTLAFAWWFRASNARAVRRPEWSYSGQIELVVWAIPAMVVILLAGVAWIRFSSARSGPAPRVPEQGDSNRGCVAGLEVAVHLSGSRRCHAQSAHRARPETRL